MTFFHLIYSILILSRQSMAVFNASAHNNLAVYWGQNSMNTHGEGAQQPLSHYCNDGNVDIILLAFVVALNDATGNVEINFANQLKSPACTTTKHPYICHEIGADIEECQKKNKTVLLSIGGAYASNETGYTSPETAQQGAVKIWQMFGPNTNSSSIRPFGKAVVNGFDFDFEYEVPFVEEFGKELRNLTKKGSTKEKPFYLSAAPQCAPTTFNSILNAVGFDMWFVQFYNNPECDARAQDKSKATIKQWNEWASKNNTSMFVGLPAGETAAQPQGIVPTGQLSEYLEEAKVMSNMAGAMLWDASQAWANGNYHVKVKEALN